MTKEYMEVSQEKNRADSPSGAGNSAFQSLLAGAKYFGILLSLVAVGYAGHQTHWSFGFVKHSTEEHATETEANPPQQVTEGSSESVGEEEWRIQFPDERSLKRSGVKTVRIAERSMHERVKTTGVITYDERMFASLSSRVPGTVWRVLKQPGDSIRRGDVLVIIDAAEVGRAKAEFFSDLVEVESRLELLSMLEKATGAVPERQIRAARVAVRESKIRLQNTEQTLINMGFALHKEAFEALPDAKRSSKLHFLGLPETLASELDPSQTTSNLFPITASFDGILLNNTVALGETVEAGKPLLEIADLRRMWLKLDVPKEDAAKLAIGQSVRFHPDGLEQELDSTISWISTEVNQQTRTLQVRAEVENPVIESKAATGQEVRMLRANTFGTGIITLQEAESAFVVPASAILHDDSQPMVFIKVGDLEFAGIDVKMGVREGGLVQIESDALRSGLEVVSQGSHVLKSEWILNHVASASP